MKNILLIYPPDRESEINPATPPLGLAYIASFVRERTPCKISLWDLNLNRVTPEQFKRRCLDLPAPPDIVGIGGIVTVFNSYLWMASIIKEVFPQCLLVAGGSLASTVPHLLYQHSPVDVCVQGAGEFTVLELAERLSQGGGPEDLRDMAGCIFWDKDEGQPIPNQPRPRLANLDQLGLPAYDLLDIETYVANNRISMGRHYRDFAGRLWESPGEIMPIMTARGCTNHCAFCFRQFPKVEMNSPSFVAEHMLLLHRQYGVNLFSIMDELFNVTKQRVLDMTSTFARLQEDIPHFGYRLEGARVDRMDQETAFALRDTGCFQVNFGLESGSQKILDLCNKRTTVEQNRAAVTAVREAGIDAPMQFIAGLPGETEQDLQKTFDFISRFDNRGETAIHFANAYPGSAMYQYAMDKGLIPDELAYVRSLGGTEKFTLQLGEIDIERLRRLVLRFARKRETKRLLATRGLFGGLAEISRLLLRKVQRGAGGC